MTAVTYRDGVAILQVIVFFPCLALAILLCIRHGFSKSSGWVLLLSLSILRLIGAICQLVAINNPSTGVITASIICISIGLSPLTLTCLGLLSRVNASVPRPIPSRLFKLIGVLSLAGICVGIYGGVNASHSVSTYYIPNSESEAAVIIFTLTYVVTMFIFVFLAAQTSHIAAGEKRLLLAVALSAPFLAVRLIYALISDFAKDPRFNSFFGDVTIYLCMAVLEEIIVVIICIAVGLTLKKVPRAQDGDAPIVTTATENMTGTMVDDAYGQMSGVTVDGADLMTEAEKGQAKGQYPSSQQTQPSNRPYVAQPARSKPRRAGGPITMLYGYGKDYYDSRKAQQQTQSI